LTSKGIIEIHLILRLVPHMVPAFQKANKKLEARRLQFIPHTLLLCQLVSKDLRPANSIELQVFLFF